MLSRGRVLLTILILTISISKAQVTEIAKDSAGGTMVHPSQNAADCSERSASFLLNSLKDKDDWQIVSGPAVKGIHYPVQSAYAKPFPSWEMDRYMADSSYFKNCDWMVLPDKKTIINTETGVPIVFLKRFTTIAPSKVNLLVKMLYDNMAYLYIDSTRIPFNHPNADINRFIQKLQPAFTGFVSLPATFNFSYNASFYAGNFYGITLPAGEHIVKIELYNNAYELGCVIKGMLISADEKKIFCTPPIKEEESERASILLFRDKKAFPENYVADTLYAALMKTVKKRYWSNNKILDEKDLITQDTLFMKKNERIAVTPICITEFRNGQLDTVYARGNIKKITGTKTVVKPWNRTLVVNNLAAGNYILEIECETPTDAAREKAGLINRYVRVMSIK